MHLVSCISGGDFCMHAEAGFLRLARIPLVTTCTGADRTARQDFIVDLGQVVSYALRPLRAAGSRFQQRR